MNPSFAREESLFADALARPEAERAGFLHEQCRDDPALLARVVALLARHDASGDFLEQDAGLSLVQELDAELRLGRQEDLTGTTIGAYRVVERLGEGGVGVVYRAEQLQPIRRQVALKVIKPGMDTREVLARFAAERHALALMDHPGIARVKDAGTTTQGRPYFVMELVAGVPLTGYCDARCLSVAARLELFIKVCQAVQHAHQKGVIHRDLKPSNILVVDTGEGVQPKIIDFGIAKATARSPAAGQALTEVAQFVGTPAYMSPEQTAGGADLDTRSDIYSLGALLYELLTGRTPFGFPDAREGGVDELRRRIRVDEPVRPSVQFVRLAAADQQAKAAARGLEPARLVRRLRGDLDWIVLRCLEKDRARRYATANGLATDIRRHLDDEPVLAAAPGRVYRLKKAVRRNRAAFAAGLAMFGALAAATVVSTSLAIRATRAERLAEQRAQAETAARAQAQAAERKAALEAATSAGISEFLRNDLLAQASPDIQPDRDVKLRTVVDRAAERLRTRFPQQPLLRAAVSETLADTYQALGDYPAMQAQCERVLALRREHLGPDHLDTLRAAVKLYDSYPVTAKLETTETLGRDTLDRLTRTVGADHPLTLQLRVALYKIMYRGRYTEAEPLLRASLADARRVLGDESPVTLSAMSDYAVVLAELERFEEASAVAEETIRLKDRVYGPEHPQTLPTMINLSAIYGQMGRYADARTLAERVYAVRTKLLGAEHPQTLTAATILTGIMVGARDYAAAEPLLQSTDVLLRKVAGAEHPATLNIALSLATIRIETGRHAEADALLAGSLDALLRKFGPGYSDTVNASVLRARVAAARQDWVAGIALLEPAVAAARTSIGPAARITLGAVYRLAGMQAAAGRNAAAEKSYREVYEQRRARHGLAHADTIEAAGGLGKFLAGLGRHADAEAPLLAWHEGLQQQPAANRVAGSWVAAVAESRQSLAALYTALGRPEEAARWRP